MYHYSCFMFHINFGSVESRSLHKKTVFGVTLPLYQLNTMRFCLPCSPTPNGFAKVLELAHMCKAVRYTFGVCSIRRICIRYTYIYGKFRIQRILEGHFRLSSQALNQIKILRSLWRDLFNHCPKTFLRACSDVSLKSYTRSNVGIPNKYIQNGIIYYKILKHKI